MITEKDLESLGLNKNLTTLYLAVIKSGVQSASQLAAVTGFTRSNVYALMQQLLAKNMVSIDFKGTKRRYKATDPIILNRLAEDRLRDVQQLMPELQALYGSGSANPRISYFEGEAAAPMVFEELVNIKDNHYCYFGSLDAQLAVEGAAAKRSVQRRLQKGIRYRAIRTREADMAESSELAGDPSLREVRYFPKMIPPHCPDLYIYDQKLAILMAGGEGFALIIESQELSTLMRVIWDMIWDISLALEELKNLRGSEKGCQVKKGE
ncbi:MAG: helix-turn-helix domain-containing protein [Deltaproteobacteria bacterium]|jgi:sugar-specific transcriptional regulator TrmB|nr:helix-turn-helix domain-containing protein [Deltaproteobacteria bacterium]